jgi:hypothetical protein
MNGLRLKVEILLLVGSEYGNDGSVDSRFWGAAGGRRDVPIRIDRHGWRRGGTRGREAEIELFRGRESFLAGPDGFRKQKVKPPAIEWECADASPFIHLPQTGVIAPMRRLRSGSHISPFLFIKLILPPLVFSRYETLFCGGGPSDFGLSRAINNLHNPIICCMSMTATGTAWEGRLGIIEGQPSLNLLLRQRD